MPVFLFCSPRNPAHRLWLVDVDADVDVDVDVEGTGTRAYSVEDTTRDGREIPFISIGYT